jgi:formylglycine-generating enzyme required for sulfatase activity
MKLNAVVLIALIALVSACDGGGGGGAPDASVDSGTDAGVEDAGTDAGGDAGIDGGAIEMVEVPAGSFMMGCNVAVDNECGGDENPYHSVTVPSFKIDKYEVTVGNYQKCVDAGVCTPAGAGSKCNYGVTGRDYHPINCVNWNQAKAYCAWIGKRLPSEAEWEKAARGTDGRKYPWGKSNLDCDHAVMSVSPCSNSGTQPVGSKPLGVSPYGALDMIGNVWEWVEDWFHDSYNGAPTDGSAWVVPAGSDRVVRGGSWANRLTYDLRASRRVGDVPSSSCVDCGFRCAQ